MQKPHCTAPAEENEVATSSRSAAATPSSVRMVLPAALSAGMAQVTFGCPSMSARQQPHCPWGWHPSLSDAIPQRSRNISSSDSPRRTSTCRAAPFNVNSICMATRAQAIVDQFAIDTDRVKEEEGEVRLIL